MDLLRKKTVAGFLPRAGTDKSLQSDLVRTNTDLSILEISNDNEKGVLGLSTLYSPLPPTSAVADVVFIHGLGGGSRKTWSFSSDPDHFWPRAWLPEDQDFKDVRVHSFGYKADWGERRQSILNIHDFARSLIGELKNNPSIRRDRTRIVLVGHSMGGCVAKKAYTLARQDPTCSDLAERVHSIFFLGTPHRGSDLAIILNTMLAVTWGKKPFVMDLAPNSSSLTEINDAFRHFAPDLRLWSFYETLPVVTKVSSKIVVEKASATLGYHNEEIAAMNADHRSVCRFDTKADPNYKMLRNALLTAVDMIRATQSELPPLYRTADWALSKPTSSAQGEVSLRLRLFLGIRDTSEDDLATLQVLKEPGSCLWFTERQCFMSWKTGLAPGILWLTGRPAAGKSVISSHVVDQMKPPYAHCSYFFFKYAKVGKSTLSDCFRALAYQMAMHDVLVRDKLLQLEDEGIVWDNADEANIWRKLFANNIFKLPSIPQHAWVIDGLDECANFNALFTKRLLAVLPSELRLFATSRSLEDIGRGLSSLGPRVNLETLSDSDTLEDMRLFLTRNLTELGHMESDEDREAMCEKILEKSSGSFLWVRLVPLAFGDAWTHETKDTVLREVPTDLQKLYSRMVQSIVADKRKVKLAKSILTWVVLASRPLTVDELRCAVKLDVNETLQSMSKAIPSLCEQLVFIDQSNKVHLIHETAREFLVTKGPHSDPAVLKTESHTRLSHLLLRYLCSEVLKFQQARTQQTARLRGFAKSSTATPTDASLLDYACSFFAEHIYLSTSDDVGLDDELCTFLRSSNVLSWMEHIAKRGDLNDITSTAIRLRGYLGRRMKYVLPTDPSVHLIDSWVTDLIRVAAKFRSQLLACPSSIHSLIPPLCPSESIISRTFTRNLLLSKFRVVGLPKGTWDDCLIRIDFDKGQTSAVGHGDRFFAVGLSTGQVSLYDRGSVQRVLNMTHPERVKILEFSRNDQYLASCGAKHVAVWELKTGTRMHLFSLHSRPLSVVFLVGEELLCATQSSEITKWNLETNEEETISWKDDGDGDYYARDVPVIPDLPSRAGFLVIGEQVLLAVGYRNHPVFIWNALELQLVAQCDVEVNNGIDDMTFNPNPETTALVVSYNHGPLCVFNYKTTDLTFTLPNVCALTIACSPDGRSLVTGNNQGTIDVFEFDQGHSGNIILTAIYRINALDDSIRGLAFSSDGLRFVDVRAQQCRVWAPAALVRKDSELESSSDIALLPPKTVGSIEGPENPEITSPLMPSADGGCVLAGKSNGTVVLFAVNDGRELGVLYRHARGVSVLAVALGEMQGIVVSADDSGRVLAAKLATTLPKSVPVTKDQNPPAATVVLDRRFGAAVVRLLINSAADRLLVCGHDVDQLWELPSGSVLGTRPPAADTAISSPPPESTATVHLDSSTESDMDLSSATPVRSVIQHPSNPTWFVILVGNSARIFSWADFNELTSGSGIRLERTAAPSRPLPPTHAPSATASYHVGPGLVVELLRPSPSEPPRLHVWPAAALNPSSPPYALPASEPALDGVSPTVLAVLGVIRASTLVYLDVNLWVCTVELLSAAAAFGSTAPSPRAGRSASVPTVVVGSSSASASALTSPSKQIHDRRHFFALSEWRDSAGKLRCALVPARTGRDLVFANGHGVVVVKGGLVL